MNIYYGDNFNLPDTRLLTPPLTNLLQEIVKNKKYGNYLRCPAAVNYLKNIYVARSPINFNIVFNYHKNIYQDTSIPEDVQQSIFTPYLPGDEHLLQVNFPQFNFFSEESCYITTLPPFMHKSSINNFAFVPGSFDISQWFRPIHLAVYNEEKSNVIINRDDPMFYIRVESQQKVKLQEYTVTEKLAAYSRQCMTFREINSGMSLKYYYSRFMLKRTNKKIIKEIKDNLI